MDRQKKKEDRKRIETEKKEEEEERIRKEQIRAERNAAVNSSAATENMDISNENDDQNDANDEFGPFVQHRVDQSNENTPAKTLKKLLEINGVTIQNTRKRSRSATNSRSETDQGEILP